MSGSLTVTPDSRAGVVKPVAILGSPANEGNRLIPLSPTTSLADYFRTEFEWIKGDEAEGGGMVAVE